jgi:hypothetical protein
MACSIVPLRMDDVFFEKDGYCYMTSDFPNDELAEKFLTAIAAAAPGDDTTPSADTDASLVAVFNGESGGADCPDKLAAVYKIDPQPPLVAIGQTVTQADVDLLDATYYSATDDFVTKLRKDIMAAHHLDGDDDEDVEVVYFGFASMLTWTKGKYPYVRGASDQVFVLGYLAWDALVDGESQSFTQPYSIDLDTGELL